MKKKLIIIAGIIIAAFFAYQFRNQIMALIQSKLGTGLKSDSYESYGDFSLIDSEWDNSIIGDILEGC